MSELFKPLMLNQVTLRNRVVVPPMCQYSATDGLPNDWHLVHYGSLAAGGAAAVIVEATAVSPEGRISPYDLGLWNDAQADRFARIFSFIESQGAVPAVQIAHAGRKACTDKPWLGGKPLKDWTNLLAPSAIPFDGESQTPLAMTVSQIHEITAKFAESATRAVRAGAQLIELHGAHGYLLSEFISPLSNKREDEYGGTPENRARFLIEIVKEVQSAIGTQIPISVRISATDWLEDGFKAEDAVELANMLKPHGVAMIDVSTSGVVLAKIPVKPGFQVPFAEKIKRETGMKTAAVGLILEAKHAESIIAEGQADIVMIGRGHLSNHQWAIHAARELGAEAPIPPQYLRGYR
jgi:2,4-dienoyl-CoA reductase-like NADH-dependent reductase (Old Yellow Enzyme family)